MLRFCVFLFFLFVVIYFFCVGCCFIFDTIVSDGSFTDFKGYAFLASGLSVGLSGLASGMAIGIAGDAGVRANGQRM